MKKLLLLCLALFYAGPVSAQVRTVNEQVIFATYAENRTHWTDPAVRGPQLVATANTFWNGPQGSWGTLQLVQAGSYPWVDSSRSMAGGCTYSVLSQIAADVDAVAGSVPQNTIRTIVLPPGTNCNDQTVGQVQFIDGTGTAIVYTMGGSFIEHETGHALGLSHAWAQFPSGPQEYGPYDVMGNSGYGGALQTLNRNRIHAFSSTFQLLTITASQDVTLQFSETMTPGIKGVLYQTPWPNNHLITAEFRGGDTGDNALSKGVIVHGAPNAELLTMDPIQQNPWRLAVGKTWCESGVLCITNLSQTDTTDTIRVQLAGDASLPPPTPPTSTTPPVVVPPPVVTPPPPVQTTPPTASIQAMVTSPASGASFPISQTSTTGFTAVVQTNAPTGTVAKVYFGPHNGSISNYTCGAPPQQYYPSCTVANGVYTFQIKTGAAPGLRDLYFTFTAPGQPTVRTPTLNLTVTP